MTSKTENDKNFYLLGGLGRVATPSTPPLNPPLLSTIFKNVFNRVRASNDYESILNQSKALSILPWEEG